MTKKEKETDDEKKERELVEEIASNIAAMSRSVKSLLGGRLKEQTIYILLAQASHLSRSQVENVLKAASNMEDRFLK